jgi:hypothetical protein
VTNITDTHATTEEPFEAVFFVGSIQRLYKESQLRLASYSKRWPDAAWSQCPGVVAIRNYETAT